MFSLAYGYSDNIESLLKKGHDSFRNQNFTDAISYFDQILKIDPNNPDALNNKGVALGNLQNYTEAISYFDQVLKIDPNNINALNNKAAALIKDDKFDEAVSLVHKVLKIDPQNLVAISNERVISNAYAPHAKPYDSSRYALFSQIEIRDKDNHIVTYLEPHLVEIPDPDYFDIYLDTFSPGTYNQTGNVVSVEKSIIKIDGKDFEKIKFTNFATYDKVDSIMVSSSGYVINGVWIIYSYHDGYQLQRGDKETISFTIIRHVR